MTGPKLHLRSDKPQTTPLPAQEPWRILVVDDDAQVHAVTDLLFKEYQFAGRPFQAVHAYSAAAALERLSMDPHIPVALVDVVMETPNAGLELARAIRNQLDNSSLRIILRTGQPGEAPERDVMLDYDINDYKAKTELTSQKLFTALVGALRNWRDVMQAARMTDQLAQANATLEHKVQARTRELSQALEHARIARGDLRQFLSMVTHEFRTPLAIIDSAAQMLLIRPQALDDGSQPRLRTIRDSVSRMVQLIDTCLADERLDSETLQLQTATTDIAPLITAQIHQQRQAHPDRTIRLVLPPVPDLCIDTALISMALGNLLNNALKYSSSSIQVMVSHQDDSIQIAVTDHGLGIPASELNHIFDRFYRADNVKGLAGTGIGLSMSRRIIQLHGGNLTVDSTENVGSTFTIRLPVPASAATA